MAFGSRSQIFRQTSWFFVAILCVLQGKPAQYGGKRSDLGRVARFSRKVLANDGKAASETNAKPSGGLYSEVP